MSMVQVRLRAWVFGVMTVISVGYTFQAFGFKELAGYAPKLIGVLAIILFLVMTLREVVRLRSDKPRKQRKTSSVMDEPEDAPLTSEILARSLRYFVLVVLFALGIWLVGTLIAGLLFLVVFMYLDRETSKRELALSLGLAALGFGLLYWLEIAWYPGLLFLN